VETAVTAQSTRPGRKTLTLLLSPVQSCYSKCVGCETCLLESGGEHSLLHLFGRWKARNRSRKIGVGTRDSAKHRADFWQHMSEIELVEPPDQSFWLAKIENSDFSAVIKYAMNFAEALIVVREIAEAEGRRHKIKAGAFERKIEGVGFDPLHWLRTGLLTRACEHCSREIN